MPLPRQFTVGRLMIAVAIVALALAIWALWFDPVRRWRRDVTDDQNGSVRWEAIRRMLKGSAAIDRATALATLNEALDSPSPRVRETALAGLGQIGHAAKPAVPGMLRALNDPRPHLRALAVDQLALVLPPGDPSRKDASAILNRMLLDPSPYVRLRAAIALAEFGHEAEALPILVGTLKGPDYMDRAFALHSIGKMGPRAAPNALAEVIALQARIAEANPADYSRFLRAYSSETRYRLGDQTAALKMLQELANDTDLELAKEAQRVLVRLSNQIPPAPE